MTLNDVEHYCSVVCIMRIVTKRLRVGSCSFNENLARTSLPSKFDYDI